MKKFVFCAIFGALALSGCATSHQYCMDHLSDYRDYDQCYSEREQRRAQIHQAFSHMGDGLANSSRIPATNCITNYYGGTAYTTCN